MTCADSFGAAPYSEAYAKERIRMADPCSLAASTGALALPCSGRVDGAVHNLNAPPDVNPLPHIDHPKMEALVKMNHIYVCGLAMDYCVLDTAINLRVRFPERRIFILVDMTRAAKADAEFTVTVLKSTVATEAGKMGDLMRTHRIELAQLYMPIYQKRGTRRSGRKSKTTF